MAKNIGHDSIMNVWRQSKSVRIMKSSISMKNNSAYHQRNNNGDAKINIIKIMAASYHAYGAHHIVSSINEQNNNKHGISM